MTSRTILEHDVKDIFFLDRKQNKNVDAIAPWSISAGNSGVCELKRSVMHDRRGHLRCM